MSPRRPDEPEVRLDGEGNPIDDQPLVQRAVDQWPLALVLLGVGAGLVVLTVNDFRLGSLIIGGSVVFAGALRTVLTRNRAGLLAVRSRTIDLVTVYSLGIALTSLAILVPPPR
jgi:hypothetical protein